MAHGNQIKVKDGGPQRGFQSPEAQAAHEASVTQNVEDSGAEPASAEVGDDTPKGPAPGDTREDPSRMVKVRSRTYVAPFRYGTKRYSLPAGKEVLVPLAVKRHLEEKGLV